MNIQINNKNYIFTDIKMTSPALVINNAGKEYYGALLETQSESPTLAVSNSGKTYYLSSPSGIFTKDIKYFDAFSYSAKKKGWCSASIRCIKVFDGVGREITMECKFQDVPESTAHSNSSNWRPDLMMDGRTDTQYWRGGSYRHTVYNRIRLRCFPPENTYISRVEYYFGSEVSYCENTAYVTYSDGRTEKVGSSWWTANSVFKKVF